MIREALKILAALLENCASAINERLDPPLPMVSRECAEDMYVQWQLREWAMWREIGLSALTELERHQIPANDETITRH